MKIYFYLENIWFRINKKLRFLLVGGFNTFLSYGLFVLFLTYFNFTYQSSLILTYIISVNISIFTMRYYVFRDRGSLMQSYMRSWIVYLSMLGFNYIFLLLLVDVIKISAVIAQGFYLIFSTFFIYIFHQKFSFKTK